MNITHKAIELSQCKRIARKLKKENTETGLTHMHFLNKAARILGYENFNHLVKLSKDE